MNQEIVIYNECTNGGDRVYTYYCPEIGAMEAYGYSAYLAAKLVKGVLCLWSTDMQLPCAVLRQEQMIELKKIGQVDEQDSTVDQIVLNLNNPEPFDRCVYDKWIQVLKARKLKVAQPLPVDEVLAGSDASSRTAARTQPVAGSVNRNMITVAIAVLVVIGIVLFAMCVGGGN